MKLKHIIIPVALLVAQQSFAQSTMVGHTLTGGLPATPNEYLGSLNGADVIFKSNGSERMRMLSTGNVGIGTNAPAMPFHVQVTGSNSGIRVTQAGTTAASIGLYNTSTGAHNYALFSTGSGNGEGAGIFGVYDYTAATYRVAVNGSGNMSLGGTTPQARLHVTGNALVTSNVGSPTSAAYIRGNNGYSGVTTPDYTWWGNDQTGLFHPAANVIGFTNGGAETMRIHSNGFVGIGTAASNPPLAKLHVDNGLVRVTGSNPSGGPMVVLGGNSVTAPNGEWGMEYDASVAGKEGLNFWKPFGSTGTSGNNYLFLSNSGRVGINTNDPIAQLTVNGKTLIGDPAVVGINTLGTYLLYVQHGILTEKLRVSVVNSGTWADYVFDENYKMKSLKEVDSFIKKNKHLPEVPSASEVEKNGVDMVEMDATLLKKIEELTLYIIAQDKRIEDLEKRNNK